jgi:hypothetical protein
MRYHFTLTIPNVSRNVEHLKLSYVVSVSIKLCNHFRNLALSYKVKEAHMLWPSSFTPSYLPKRNENLWSQKELFMNIHSCFIYNSPKQAQYPATRELIKRIVVHEYHRMLLSNKKGWIIVAGYNMQY